MLTPKNYASAWPRERSRATSAKDLASMSIEFHWGKRSHCASDNVWKGVADAILTHDSEAVACFTQDYAPRDEVGFSRSSTPYRLSESFSLRKARIALRAHSRHSCGMPRRAIRQLWRSQVTSRQWCPFNVSIASRVGMIPRSSAQCQHSCSRLYASPLPTASRKFLSCT